MPEILPDGNEDSQTGLEWLDRYVLDELRKYPPKAHEQFLRGILDAQIILRGSHSHKSSNGTVTYFDDGLSEVIRIGFEHLIVGLLSEIQQNKHD